MHLKGSDEQSFLFSEIRNIIVGDTNSLNATIRNPSHGAKKISVFSVYSSIFHFVTSVASWQWPNHELPAMSPASSRGCQPLAAAPLLNRGWAGVLWVPRAACRPSLCWWQKLINIRVLAQHRWLCSYCNNHKSLLPAVSSSCFPPRTLLEAGERHNLRGAQWGVNSKDKGFQSNGRVNSSLGELNFGAGWSSMLLTQTGIVLWIWQVL